MAQKFGVMEGLVLRIVVLVDRLVLGGLETHIISFTNELLRRGHKILLCTEYALSEIISQINVSKDAFHHINGFNKCEQIIKDFNPDIIHAHPFSAIRKGVSLSRALKKPLVVTVHGIYDPGLCQPLARGQVSDKVSRIIAVDDGVAAYLHSILSDSHIITVLYNGIDLNTFSPPPPNSIERQKYGLNPDWMTITAISRLDDDKSPPIFQLVQCSGSIAARLSGVNLMLVGDGNTLSHLKREAESIMASNHNVKIIFVGRKSDVRPFIALADLVMACDRSAMEAMACSRPVFAANGAGFAGMLGKKNYRDILFYRRGYSPLSSENLANNLANALLSPGILQEAAQHGPGVIKDHFDIQQKVAELEQIYHTLRLPDESKAFYAESFPGPITKSITINPIRISVRK